MIIDKFKPYIFNGDIKKFISPPFDIITWEQEYNLRSRNENIINLTIPDKVTGMKGSKTILDRWLNENIINLYDREIIIILKQSFNFNKEMLTRYGIISLVEINDDIKPHENTFEKQVYDRKNIMKNLNSQLEPIFIVVPDNNFDRLIRRESVLLEEKYKFEEPSGVINYVYFLDDPEKINKIKDSLKNITGVVADGHHRLRAIRELYSETDDNFWKFAMSYITSIYDNGLMIGGVHRLVYGINFEVNINKIKNFFDIRITKNIENGENIYIYSNNKFYEMIPKEYILNEKFDGSGPLPTGVINKVLFEEALSMKEKEMGEKVRYIYNYTDAINAVDQHECDFAILIPSWQKERFLKLILENKILPQKSTYFYPKIPSGIAVYIKPS